MFEEELYEAIERYEKVLYFRVTHSLFVCGRVASTPKDQEYIVTDGLNKEYASRNIRFTTTTEIRTDPIW